VYSFSDPKIRALHLGILTNFVWRTDRQQFPVIYRHDAIRDLANQVHVVLHHDECYAQIVFDVVEPKRNVIGFFAIQTGRWFIEKQ